MRTTLLVTVAIASIALLASFRSVPPSGVDERPRTLAPLAFTHANAAAPAASAADAH